MHTVADMKLVTLESVYLDYAKNSSCRLLCITALVIYTILYSAQWVQWVWTWSETKKLTLITIGFTEISILRLFKTAWFPASTQNTLYDILCWVSEQMSKYTVKTFFCLKTDLISFFIYVLCYIFWFSKSVSNMSGTTFNWAKWVKWVIQGQELNISLWNLFLWIQCPRIGVRDRNSYFYHQILFLEVILLSTLSKMSNYMVKTSKFCLGTHIIRFSTLELG